MDTKNESYICFRRREIKAIRKTRAQQATYSDKMARLQAELITASDMANGVLRREQLKRETSVHSNAVWKKRCDLVDLKRKFPSLGTKEDEELFHDKERVAKKLKPDIAYVRARVLPLLSLTGLVVAFRSNCARGTTASCPLLWLMQRWSYGRKNARRRYSTR